MHVRPTITTTPHAGHSRPAGHRRRRRSSGGPGTDGSRRRDREPCAPLGAAALARVLALPLALALAAAVVRRVVVEGDSMAPTLEAGDRLVVVRVPGALRRALLRPLLRPGLVVAAPDPREPGRLLVKRVSAVATDGRITLAGDNPARSTDSRTFGGVDRASILGPVVYRYAPEGRTGRLPPLAPATRGGDDRSREEG